MVGWEPVEWGYEREGDREGGIWRDSRMVGVRVLS